MVANRRAVLQTRLAYGFGAVASGVMVAGLSGAVLQVYLNKVVGLSALSVGTIILVSLIADSVVDPLIGYWSDHVRSGRGRRHPFMYAAAVPISLSTYFLWNAPARLQGGLLMTFTVIMMITVRIAASLYVIPSDALLPELTTDYDERTTLTSYRWFFGILGGSGVSYLLNAVFLRTSPTNSLGILNRPRLRAFRTIVGGHHSALHHRFGVRHAAAGTPVRSVAAYSDHAGRTREPTQHACKPLSARAPAGWFAWRYQRRYRARD